MPKHADLFCHTILFAKLNMLANFNLHFFENVEDPHMIFQWSKGMHFPPESMERSFSKSFYWQMRDKFLAGKFIGGLFGMKG